MDFHIIAKQWLWLQFHARHKPLSNSWACRETGARIAAKNVEYVVEAVGGSDRGNIVMEGGDSHDVYTVKVFWCPKCDRAPKGKPSIHIPRDLLLVPDKR